LVTGLATNGSVIPIFGVFFYLDRTDQTVARHALIDLATARLIWPARESLDSISVVLPDWDTVLRYTKVAHEACSNFVFVGWDVAFTENGPMILEGNINWSADDYQRLRGEPLGCTRFAEILTAHLSRADDTTLWTSEDKSRTSDSTYRPCPAPVHRSPM
jgi:hypothetical protein